MMLRFWYILYNFLKGGGNTSEISSEVNEPAMSCLFANIRRVAPASLYSLDGTIYFRHAKYR